MDCTVRLPGTRFQRQVCKVLTCSMYLVHVSCYYFAISVSDIYGVLIVTKSVLQYLSITGRGGVES